jgi:hypothetical protein
MPMNEIVSSKQVYKYLTWNWHYLSQPFIIFSDHPFLALKTTVYHTIVPDHP